MYLPDLFNYIFCLTWTETTAAAAGSLGVGIGYYKTAAV